jgi:hypothetical protein
MPVKGIDEPSESNRRFDHHAAISGKLL